MTRPAGTLALGLAVLIGPSCGKKGPLVLPLAREPQAPISFSAVQRGDTIILEWTNPAKYLDGHPLPGLSAVEVWAYEPASGSTASPKVDEFEKKARLARRLGRADMASAVRRPAEKTEEWAFSLPLPDVGPSSREYAVRLFDLKNRPSKFCAPARVDIRVCPLPPQLQAIRLLPDHLEVRWTPPEANIDGSRPPAVGGYTVYRSDAGGPLRRLTPAPVPGPFFEDRSFSFGSTYSYTVRACAPGAASLLESADSAAVSVTPHDTFPPEPPSGLVALAGLNVISLSWDAGRDPDLEGYRVWRKEVGSAAFLELRPGLIRENVYTDASAEKGKIYVYAVSSRDRSGNESVRTETPPVSLRRS